MTYSSWFFDKEDFKRTPSVLDGISIETEQRYRREGARFINKVGTKMNLRYDTMATGVVYFHRFYMCHSFKQFPRYITACCCLFLAGKVEETPKKCKDIIKTAKMFITDAQFLKFGEDPKEEVLTLERILLQTINFDLQVDHPYNYLLKYAKILVGDKEKLQKMVQMAWTFINDSMCTTICLQWEPEVTAIAVMFLSGKLTKFEVIDWEGRTPQHKKWWDMFVEDISTNLLEGICHQVLDLYSMPMPDTPIDSPPTSPVTGIFDSTSSVQTQSVAPNRSNLIQLSNPTEMSSSFPNSIPASNQQQIPVIPAINNNLPLNNSIPNHQPIITGSNQMARMPIPMNINHQQLISQQNYNYKNIHSVHPTLISPHQQPNLRSSTGPPMPPMSANVGSIPQQFYRYQNQGAHLSNNGHQNSNQLVSGPPTYPNM